MSESKYGVLKNTVMDEPGLLRTLTRLSHEIVERDKGAENVVLVGIRRRGVPIARFVKDRLLEIAGQDVPCGELDISFYRDDIEKKTDMPKVEPPKFDFSVENKTVILVDDVLYTGRTARAAIEAIFTLGRPAAIQLLVVVDRGHRELPIRADFVGKNLPTSRSERVRVLVPEFDRRFGVELYE